jgi:hypothetical protein
MLAKQVWRLLSEPNSPCARVLKENIIWMVVYSEQRPRWVVLSLGKVFLWDLNVSRRGTYGEWEMEHKLIFGVIIGYQEVGT